jgi:uncharacterized protein YqhQ
MDSKLNIRSGQSGEYGVMYSDGKHTVSCRQMNGEIEYFRTLNKQMKPWLYRVPFIRVMEKLRLMFLNTHEHVHFLKGSKQAPKIMPFYLRFFLFMLVVTPLYLGLMWTVDFIVREFPNDSLELAIEGLLMYGLFMLVASTSMSLRSKRYHSAEHQAVNAFREYDKNIALDHVKASSRFHASCGTGAAFSVAVGVFITLSIFYFIVPKSEFLMHSVLNILLFPIGVSVGMELFSFIPLLYRKTGIVLLVYPSFLLQRFTTKKATDEELQVAMLAIKKTIEYHK